MMHARRKFYDIARAGNAPLAAKALEWIRGLYDVERAVKGPVLGRKNYLFAGSDAGGQRGAVIYSLVETCKRNAIDPFAYLQAVLASLPTHPANRLDELLPYNWKRDKHLDDAA